MNKGNSMQQVTVNGKTYNLIKLLGKGKGGYSYLAEVDGKLVVVKKIHHEPCSYYNFGDKMQAELNDYQKLCQIGIPMPKMLDFDIDLEIIVKQYIDGPTVYQMVLENNLPQTCVEQVVEMCKKLYANNTNIDYFPTNFVLCDDILYYIDYECNTYMDEWNYENWGIKYWSQTPEFLSYAKEHQ